MLFSFACVIVRGIVTILIIINFDMIESVCDFEFTKEAGTAMAIQFVVVLVIFLVLEIFLGLVGFLQATEAKNCYTCKNIILMQVMR